MTCCVLPDDENILSVYPSQSDTEQFGVCAPDRQTTFMRAGHNASWSTILTADGKCGRCIFVHIRSLEHALQRQRHRRGARFGDRVRARRNRRLASFSNWRRSSSSRIALERRSSGGRCNTGNSTGCVSSRRASSSLHQRPAALLELLLLARRQLALGQLAPHSQLHQKTLRLLLRLCC